MSDTPETEMHSPASYAIIRPDGVRTDYVPAEFARKLERERDKARNWVFRLRKQRAIARSFGEQMERERNEAREAFAIATSNCVDAHQRLREIEREATEAVQP
jgi:hypothetical protein